MKFWLKLKISAKRQLYSSRFQLWKKYLCIFFRSGDILRRHEIHYVIKTLITSLRRLLGILALNFGRKFSAISEKVDEIVSEKSFEFCSPRRFQRYTIFRDILGYEFWAIIEIDRQTTALLA